MITLPSALVIVSRTEISTYIPTLSSDLSTELISSFCSSETFFEISDIVRVMSAFPPSSTSFFCSALRTVSLSFDSSTDTVDFAPPKAAATEAEQV